MEIQDLLPSSFESCAYCSNLNLVVILQWVAFLFLPSCFALVQWFNSPSHEDGLCTLTALLLGSLTLTLAGVAQPSEWHSIRGLKNGDNSPEHCTAHAQRAVCCRGLEHWKISVFLPCLQRPDRAVSAGLSAWWADSTLHLNMLSRTWEEVCLLLCVCVVVYVCVCAHS